MEASAVEQEFDDEDLDARIRELELRVGGNSNTSGIRDLDDTIDDTDSHQRDDFDPDEVGESPGSAGGFQHSSDDSAPLLNPARDPHEERTQSHKDSSAADPAAGAPPRRRARRTQEEALAMRLRLRPDQRGRRLQTAGLCSSSSPPPARRRGRCRRRGLAAAPPLDAQAPTCRPGPGRRPGRGAPSRGGGKGEAAGMPAGRQAAGDAARERQAERESETRAREQARPLKRRFSFTDEQMIPARR